MSPFLSPAGSGQFTMLPVAARPGQPQPAARAGFRLALLLLAAALPASGARAQDNLILADDLAGSTSGVRSGGEFTDGGWKVTGTDDYIYWHIPTLTAGAVEFDVTGLPPDDCRPENADKSELFHMYDYTFGNADTQYNGGYRDDPFKHFIRKTNCMDTRPGKLNSLELVWQILPNYEEPDTAPLAWDATATYRFREEWEPVGDNSTLRTYRDGVLLREITIPGLWNPTGHSIRIGASPRSPLYDDFGAPPNAVFSRIRVYSVACAPPAAPTLTAPAANETLPSATVGALWEGDAHSHVQLRITREPDLDSELLWDSGLLESPNDWIWSGKLPQQTPAYAAVRLGNLCGVGPWSEPVGPFNLDRGYEPQEADTVRLVGAVLVDNQGPFLGLGASYFQAMRRCKYDRDRFESDLSFLAANEFRYIRILSMVGWYEAWQGLEIAPVSFNNRANVPVAAWEDYWQQFRDCIDIAYEHGLRTEVTIFADAQMMPDKADRIAHMDTMLENLVGREHKVILLEVGNEAWQNGFSGAQGRADLREFGQYLAERTEIPVALSAPDDISDAGINLLYSGSAADIATVHFTRDLAPDAGWAPVYDIYRTGLVDVPPMSSNEPIGPGASVNSENDPVKLVMAAVYAWAAGLPMYVFHCEAGVFGSSTFEGTPAIDAYDHLDDILPPDLSGWARNNGIMPDSPFITYCEGQPDTPWSAVPGANDGVIRNNGATNGCDFIALPIAVLADGVELEPRRPMALNVHHPLTGEIVDTKTLAAGERFTLPQGPGAWILRGRYLDCAVGTGVGDWTRY